MKAKHTSTDKHLKRHLIWIEALESVQKVVLGFSEACRHKYPAGHIRIVNTVPGGLKAIAYSGKGVTELFIRISPESAILSVKQQIEVRFSLD